MNFKLFWLFSNDFVLLSRYRIGLTRALPSRYVLLLNWVRLYIYLYAIKFEPSLFFLFFFILFCWKSFPNEFIASKAGDPKFN